MEESGSVLGGGTRLFECRDWFSGGEGLCGREYVLLDTFVMLQEEQYQGSLELPSFVNSDEDIPIQSLWIHVLHSSQAIAPVLHAYAHIQHGYLGRLGQD